MVPAEKGGEPLWHNGLRHVSTASPPTDASLSTSLGMVSPSPTRAQEKGLYPWQPSRFSSGSSPWSGELILSLQSYYHINSTYESRADNN